VTVQKDASVQQGTSVQQASAGGGCSTGGTGSLMPLVGLLGFFLTRRRRLAKG
jgi:uncharacterized protein (TIGR03382 family)